jgi:hypothetical protein
VGIYLKNVLSLYLNSRLDTMPAKSVREARYIKPFSINVNSLLKIIKCENFSGNLQTGLYGCFR